MLRILLLDCTESLESKLKKQGFDVEAGTAGRCSGIKRLPSQVYEKDIFFYDPRVHPSSEVVQKRGITDLSPEFDLKYLADRILSGATFVVFVNRLSPDIEVQKWLYGWIPYMPEMANTSDKVVHGNQFRSYPDTEVRYLAPLVTTSHLSLPVQLKLASPKPQDHPRDVFYLFWNGRNDDLGFVILRGRGSVIFLPRYESNDEIIETFLHRIAPRIYEESGKRTLIDLFASPAEQVASDKIKKLVATEEKLKKLRVDADVELSGATREKIQTIKADAMARQILVYYDQAKREDDAALFYLYKIVEAVENKFGGESEGIKALGAGVEWKAVKKLANESYRDARHAPRPGDVIRKWTETEIKECFTNAEVVACAYFSTLFPIPV